ncbi:DUF5816 domain-containing protein [Halosegnis longus]|uniref:GNAT family acetyltransferase n=1 Tax=Halosegnis longus TaxID=2216012 RepID=A0AAJ4R8Y9_9EURY|nr:MULTISPECIES: DUF5816 domain-containing protein [Halobacteriales]RNJ26763.1 GNAT family acetyltransferase [Salella cibi]
MSNTTLEERDHEGETLYVSRREAEKGADAPFFVVYVDEARERPWGYLCGNCDSLSTAMDSMGRVKCNDCGNFKRPDEWDAAHE